MTKTETNYVKLFTVYDVSFHSRTSVELSRSVFSSQLFIQTNIHTQLFLVLRLRYVHDSAALNFLVVSDTSTSTFIHIPYFRQPTITQFTFEQASVNEILISS